MGNGGTDRRTAGKSISGNLADMFQFFLTVSHGPPPRRELDGEVASFSVTETEGAYGRGGGDSSPVHQRTLGST